MSKQATFLSLMSVVAERNLELHQVDVKTAFLNDVLEEEVFVRQPAGYPKGDSDKVCKLNKALYGLR